MFRVPTEQRINSYRPAIFGLMLLSAAALTITIWVMVDFLREQEIVQELIQELPRDATARAEALAGELRWQFRLSILVVLNLVVTGIAVVLLWRAYRSSQESLRDIKALAADILSSVDQAVITTDLDGTVTSINRRGLELLRSDSECVGQPLRELSEQIPLDAFSKDWQADPSLALTRDFPTERDGTTRILQSVCQSLNDYEGNQIGYVLQLRDITERLLIDDRLLRMERYMGLGSLAAGLHHEIKNPLAALSLHVQLLEEQIDEDATSQEVAQLLGVIKAEVTRVGDVLESFRDFASVDRLNYAAMDIVSLVQRQIELITPRANQQGITINFAPSATSSAAVVGDRVRLEQVLLNLLVNAMDAMPGGGTLTVCVTKESDAAKISISDTGTGIPGDLRERIFDPYFTTKSTGTGLGLALSDKIIRQHHGILEFESSPSGTKFSMTIPWDSSECSPEQEPVSLNIGRGEQSTA